MANSNKKALAGMAAAAVIIGGAAWALAKDDKDGPQGTGPAGPSPWDTEDPTRSDMNAEQEMQWIQAVYDYSYGNASEQMDPSIARAGANKLLAQKYTFDEVAAEAAEAAQNLQALANQIEAANEQGSSGGEGSGGYGVMETGDDWSLSE